jgi:hypothetical protein
VCSPLLRLFRPTRSGSMGGTPILLACMLPTLRVLLDLCIRLPLEFACTLEEGCRRSTCAGWKMEAAKRTLQLCLRSLPEGCMFQVVSFGSHYTKLFPGALRLPTCGGVVAYIFAEVVSLRTNLGGLGRRKVGRSVHDAAFVCLGLCAHKCRECFRKGSGDFLESPQTRRVHVCD